MRHLVFTSGYTEPIRLGSGEIVPGRCRGISAFFLEEDGSLGPLGCSPSVPNPSYLTVRGDRLYCVSERKDFYGMPSSTVSGYRLDRASGALTLLGTQLTGGQDACFVTVSPDGKWLLCANFTGGSVCVLPIGPDGAPGCASCILRHAGRGSNPQRQASPHPHQIVFSPDGRFVYVSDLGLDRLVCYRLDPLRGWLQPAAERDIAVPAGQGARHFVFNKAGTRLYLMTEMACSVDVFSFDAASGRAALLQTLCCLPEGAPESLGAAIRLSPDETLLFCSVRGCNRIASCRVKPDGTLALLQLTPSGGEIPRDFVLSPDGRYLLVGHQDTDTLLSFAVDRDTGALTLVSTQPSPCTTTVGIL